ncbi:MAG: hypothetical protein V1866_02215 [archaeon]
MAFINEKVSEDPILNDVTFKQSNTQPLTVLVDKFYEPQTGKPVRQIAISNFELTAPYVMDEKGNIRLMSKMNITKFGLRIAAFHAWKPEAFTVSEVERLANTYFGTTGAYAVKIDSVQPAVYKQNTPGLKGTHYEDTPLNAFKVSGSYVHSIQQVDRIK